MDRDAGGRKKEGTNGPQGLGWIKLNLLVVGEGNEYILHLLGGSNCAIHRLNSTLLKTGPTSMNLILYSQDSVYS